jgi:hypothetical protein
MSNLWRIFRLRVVRLRLLLHVQMWFVQTAS